MIDRDQLPPPLLEVVQAAREKKAFDIKVLDLADLASFADQFVLMSGSSARQVQAIADAAIRGLKKAGRRVAHVEGYTQGDWVLIDCGDFIVHIFTPAKRTLYALERLWSDAPVVEVPEAVA